MKNIDKLKKVMKSELCNRCGSCVGLSQGKIIFNNKEGKYLPQIVGDIDDESAKRIWNSCAGKEFSFPEYREIFYKDSPNFHTYTGPYHNIYIGYTPNEQVRRNGASGGIISAVLIYLLEKGEIDGAITLRMSKEKPWLSEAFIATSKEEILEAAQSKYTISSVNEILPQAEKFEGKLAYVGLPPQVMSIRKLQAVNDPSVKNIKYIFGPFYGNTLYFSSVKSFIKTYGEKDHTQIEKLYFRHGEWPGNMRVEFKSGKVIELKKFHANYLIPFHVLRNSLYCTDLANEFTDISGGDAWAPVYEDRGKGFSMILTRTPQGQKILDDMVNDGCLSADMISEDEAISMHSHGYDFKKRGSFIRIKFRKWLGMSVPDYGYTIKDFPLSRYFMEVVISGMFWAMSTSLARWTVEQFSPKFIGNLFEKARTSWKKSTHKIKRTYLS
ncbi:MAG: Coenzyme F420 hydrogenase/dehydrogenase, beta subunit C-terminal domain [Bacteroidales bacterium]|nr:Coenzyme F420 hydrogenase/dehydrogenase, beta subunit C-terminal domain [Bacteroidales bacterium]